MKKWIIKKVNQFIFDCGYSKGIRDGKQKIIDVEEHNETKIYNVKMSHELENFARDKEEKRLNDIIKAMKTNVQEAEKIRLACKKERRESEIFNRRLEHTVKNLQNRFAAPLSEMLHMIDDDAAVKRQNKIIEL